MYHWIFLFRRFGKLFLQLLTFQKVHGILNTVQKLKRMWVKTIQRLRGCLHVKFHPGIKLVPGWNHPVYGEMPLTVYTFLPRWNFILGWTHPRMKDRDEKKKKRRVNTSSRDEILKWASFFNFWVCIQVCCPNSACLNIMKVWI